MKVEAISKHRPLTGQGLEAHVYNSPKNFNVFSLILLRFREFGATAPQTYGQFRTSNGAGDVLYVLSNSLTALGLEALFFRRAKMWA